MHVDPLKPSRTAVSGRERLRVEWIAGAEEEWRRRRGDPLGEQVRRINTDYLGQLMGGPVDDTEDDRAN